MFSFYKDYLKNFVYNLLLTYLWPITTKPLSLLKSFYASFFKKLDRCQMNY